LKLTIRLSIVFFLYVFVGTIQLCSKYIDTVNINSTQIATTTTTIDDIINANVSPPTVSDDEEYEVAHNESFVQTHIEITGDYESMDETDTIPNDMRSTDTLESHNLPATYKVFCCGETYNPRSPLLNRPGGAVKIITKLSAGGEEVHTKVEETASDQRKVSLSDDGGGGGVGDIDRLKAQKQSKMHHKLKDKKNICNLSLSAPSTSSQIDGGGRVSPSKSYDEMIQFVFTEHGIKVISDKEYVV
jgi:hypothetical protein